MSLRELARVDSIPVDMNIPAMVDFRTQATDSQGEGAMIAANSVRLASGGHRLLTTTTHTHWAHDSVHSSKRLEDCSVPTRVIYKTSSDVSPTKVA